MNIVCDTNVLVSGILFAGPPREIIRLASTGIVTNSISADILREVEDVLLRPKFSLKPDQVLYIMGLFRDTFDLVVPACRVDVVHADPDDNRILEAAHAAQAKLIVSGDKHLLDLSRWGDIPIVTPARFVTGIVGRSDPP